MASRAYIEKVSGRVFEFGPFRLNEDERLLLRDGGPVPLTPKVFDTLSLLVQNAGHLVDKDELMRLIWPDSFVEEVNLNRAISTLRRALGETPNERSYIETVPKRGYRFIAEVTIGKESVGPSLFGITAADELGQVESSPGASVPESATAEKERLDGVIELKVSRGINRRAVAITSILVLSTGASLFLIFSNKSQSARAAIAKPAVTSLAVLPFKTLLPAGKDDDPGLGITDVLITRLSNVKEIIVRPTSAVLKYKDHDQNPLEAGRALRVDTVLEGSVQRVDERIRVTVRLMDVKTEAQLFGGSFTEPAADMLKVQDAIAERVAKALAVELDPDAAGYTRNTKAHDLYVKGRAAFNRRDPASIMKSQLYFRQAIEADPNFALAYVGVADAYAIQDNFYESEMLHRRALDLDPNLGEAHASLGFRYMFYDWDWERAEQSFRRAIELKPGYVNSYLWYGNLLAITGRLEEARETIQRGLEIDPFSPNLLADLGQFYYFSHEYDKAEELCLKALEIQPNFYFACEYLSDIYRQRGEFAKSLEIGSKQGGLDVLDGLPPPKAETGEQALQRWGGWRRYLETELNSFKTRPAEGYWGAAKFSAELGDKQQALDWLDKAYERRPIPLAFVGVDPVWDDLRSEPRYQDLLERMRLKRWISRR